MAGTSGKVRHHLLSSFALKNGPPCSPKTSAKTLQKAASDGAEYGLPVVHACSGSSRWLGVTWLSGRASGPKVRYLNQCCESLGE